MLYVLLDAVIHGQQNRGGCIKLFLAVNSVLWMMKAPPICSHNTMANKTPIYMHIYRYICVYTA